MDEFRGVILKAKKKKRKGYEEEEIWDDEKGLVSCEEFIGDSSFRRIWEVQTTYTDIFEEDTLQHARVEGQPALPWGPCTNSNHTVKRSHTWLHLGEDDHHATTGQWYVPEFEEGAAATFSPLIINTHQVVFFLIGSRGYHPKVH